MSEIIKGELTINDASVIVISFKAPSKNQEQFWSKMTQLQQNIRKRFHQEKALASIDICSKPLTEVGVHIIRIWSTLGSYYIREVAMDESEKLDLQVP